MLHATADTAMLNSGIPSGKFRLAVIGTSVHYIQECYAKLYNYLFNLYSFSKQI
jgi:hypothetical protein